MFRRTTLPDGIVPRKDSVLVESYSGHHHVIENEGVRAYSHPSVPGVGYFVFGKRLPQEPAAASPERTARAALVRHQRSDGHGHKTLRIEPAGKTTVVEFHQQVQFRPEGLTFVVD